MRWACSRHALRSSIRSASRFSERCRRSRKCSVSACGPESGILPTLGAEVCGGCVLSDPRSGYARNSRSEEHTSELQSLMRISYAVLCLKKKIIRTHDIVQDTKVL